MKKPNENIIEKWDSEARKKYYEEAYKRIYQAILHNQILIRRLMTKDGTNMVGKDKALAEINQAEQFIKDQTNEMNFLIEVMKSEHIIG